MALFAGKVAVKQAVDYFAAHIYQPRASDVVPLFAAHCQELQVPPDLSALDRFLAEVIDALRLRSIRIDALIWDRLRYDVHLQLGLGGAV